ncbi:sensor histidine kinase [Bryobacterales bacterium F-183]|nr:sensor histidine kinase [Bryobacterales bacterium F-183]
MEQPCTRPTAEELASLPIMEGEDPAAIAWLAERFQIHCFETGDIIAEMNSAADELWLVLDGEVHFRVPEDPYAALFIRTKGQATGKLPFSRIKNVLARGTAVQPTRLAAMPDSELRELVYRAPLFAERLVQEMIDRTRDFARLGERSSKLQALGKMAAGLAHEINNPASAAVRSAALLREALDIRRTIGIELRSQPLDPQTGRDITDLADRIAGCDPPPEMDALDRADLESDFGDWLDQYGSTSEYAGDLIDAGITMDDLKPLAGKLDRENFARVLRILAADRQIHCLTSEIEDGLRRISELVKAMKSYSYMDRGALTEVEIEPGIEVTLRLFQHKLKDAKIQLEKHFAGNLPKIPGNGSELNQVWTNLIDNAISALKEHPTPGKPQRIEVRTSLEPGYVLVEVADNGPGIPAELQGRIFEPFFTTKKVGEGTGLGLDIVRRILQNHKAQIRLESAPGRTVFQVRIPLSVA